MQTKGHEFENVSNLKLLANAIQLTSHFFLTQVQKQVNIALCLRNWIIGYYIVEYEQNGKDRATYGKKLFAKLAENSTYYGLKIHRFKIQLTESHLNLL